jgi:hypothetical protein
VILVLTLRRREYFVMRQEGTGEESEEPHTSRSKTDVKHQGETFSAYISVTKAGKKPLGRSMRRGEDNINPKEKRKFLPVLY